MDNLLVARFFLVVYHIIALVNALLLTTYLKKEIICMKLLNQNLLLVKK